MRIINLGNRPRWIISKEDIKSASDIDLVSMKIPGGYILLKIKDILNRYEQGEGNSGKPSVDWLQNGKHQSYADKTDIPDWITEKNYISNSILRKLLFQIHNGVERSYRIDLTFSLGEVLRHDKFGKGIIISTIDKKVTVLFEDGLCKELVANVNIPS